MTAITFAAPAAPLAGRPRLRITARGRAVVGTLIAAPLAALALFLGLGAAGAVATQSPSSATFEYVTVSAGESLWDIAADVAPSADPREFAAQVVALNQLASATVQPGQQLAIPHQYAD